MHIIKLCDARCALKCPFRASHPNLQGVLVKRGAEPRARNASRIPTSSVPVVRTRMHLRAMCGMDMSPLRSKRQLGGRLVVAEQACRGVATGSPETRCVLGRHVRRSRCAPSRRMNNWFVQNLAPISSLEKLAGTKFNKCKAGAYHAHNRMFIDRRTADWDSNSAVGCLV